MSSPLFASGDFTSHSGLALGWKINCDALTPEDWDCVAKVVAARYKFRRVFGVPRGGLAFAAALVPHIDPTAKITLITDDVLTTGRSMEEMKFKTGPWDTDEVVGVVLFRRTHVHADWIVPVFGLNPKFAD